MSLFGFLWLIIMVICFFSSGMKLITFFTLFFMMFQSNYVLYIDGRGVGPQILTSCIFILKYLITYYLSNGFVVKLKYNNNKNVWRNFALNIFILFLFFNSAANNIIDGNYLNIIQIAIYIICFYCMQNVYKYISEREFDKVLKKLVLITVVFGVLQLVVTFFDITLLRLILKEIFYNDNSMNIYFNYNDMYHNSRIYSFFMEPSYYAGVLVGGLFYLLAFKEFINKNIKWLILIVVSILLTTSSTAYGALFIVSIIFIFFSKNLSTKKKIIIVLSALVLAAIIFPVFYDVLDKVIFSKAASGSGITRARWNREAFEAFLSSPIYGVGYKNVRGSSIIYSLLGELGIVGAMIFISAMFLSLKKIFELSVSAEKYSKGYVGTMYAVLSVFVCQIIACPDIDLCTLWFWMYALSIYEGYNKRKG